MRSAIAALALLVCGCVQANLYQEISDTAQYGYKETKRADGSYLLRVVYPGGATTATHDAVSLAGKKAAFDTWDRRAGELCQGHTYSKNIFKAERPMVSYQYYGGRPGDFVIEGYLTCNAT